jgi:DNA-binding SARP family transcriptional activator
MTVAVTLLGPLRMTAGGQEVRLGGQGRRAVVAMLALGPGSVVSVDRLVDALWDEAPPMTAVTKLQGHICGLRRELNRLAPGAGAAIVTMAPGYLMCDDLVTTDLAEFEALAARGSREPDPGVRVTVLERALRLWYGHACSDVRSSRVAAAAATLDERHARLRENLADARLGLGDVEPALDDMHQLVLEQPFREHAWEMIMRCHIARGDPAAALATYHRVVRLLGSELGAVPGRRLRALAAGADAAGHLPLAAR